MGIGIQIKKPEHVKVESVIEDKSSKHAQSFPPLFYLMMGLTFPAALLALYFFLQTRNV